MNRAKLAAGHVYAVAAHPFPLPARLLTTASLWAWYTPRFAATRIRHLAPSPVRTPRSAQHGKPRTGYLAVLHRPVSRAQQVADYLDAAQELADWPATGPYLPALPDLEGTLPERHADLVAHFARALPPRYTVDVVIPREITTAWALDRDTAPREQGARP